MTIGFTFNADPTQEALDPNEVWIQFLCTTGPGKHDPEDAPDSMVRPEHAALHGTYWKLDNPGAPIPPLSAGCRCTFIYVANPNAGAVELLPTAKGPAEVDGKVSGIRWLNAHSPGWEKVAAEVAKAQPQQASAIAHEMAQAVGVPESHVCLILQAQEPAPLAPLGNACKLSW